MDRGSQKRRDTGGTKQKMDAEEETASLAVTADKAPSALAHNRLTLSLRDLLHLRHVVQIVSGVQTHDAGHRFLSSFLMDAVVLP